MTVPVHRQLALPTRLAPLTGAIAQRGLNVNVKPSVRGADDIVSGDDPSNGIEASIVYGSLGDGPLDVLITWRDAGPEAVARRLAEPPFAAASAVHVETMTDAHVTEKCESMARFVLVGASGYEPPDFVGPGPCYLQFDMPIGAQPIVEFYQQALPAAGFHLSGAEYAWTGSGFSSGQLHVSGPTRFSVRVYQYSDESTVTIEIAGSGD